LLSDLLNFHHHL